MTLHVKKGGRGNSESLTDLPKGAAAQAGPGELLPGHPSLSMWPQSQHFLPAQGSGTGPVGAGLGN